ncbi:DUF317 domain-containing protein [Streptomyces paludis]|uniref:DUF317 domain-containing protein n=1 Tax=Streptomyces paludis TaxID=2282738 RepID=UPI001E6229CA|nr:DUF317 domain-containing protein [Streptomyces paludis]
MKVLPRHLAGPGHTDPQTIWPFPFDQDWTLHQPGEGAAYATSPCLRLWTRFLPNSGTRGKGMWTIGANRAPFGETAWRITFDATTPAELLHDVHTELLDLYLEDRHSDRDHLFEDATAPHEVYTPLLARGWSHSIKTDGTLTFHAPEGEGTVRHRYATTGSDGPTWRAWAGDSREPLWQARFSSGVPTTLAAALTASLVSNEPLHRAVEDIPFLTRHHLYVAPAAAKQPLTNSAPALPPATRAVGRTR